MKYIAILLIIVLLALPVCGDSFLKDKVSLSISTLQINNTRMDHYLDSPVGLTVDYKLSEEGSVENGISIGYFTVDQADVFYRSGAVSTRRPAPNNYTMSTIPIMLTQRWTFRQGSKLQPYLGYGFGFSWTRQEIDEEEYDVVGTRGPAPRDFSTTHMTGAYQFTAGAKFGNGFFLDAKYVSGGENVNSGCLFSLGKSF